MTRNFDHLDENSYRLPQEVPPLIIDLNQLDIPSAALHFWQALDAISRCLTMKYFVRCDGSEADHVIPAETLVWGLLNALCSSDPLEATPEGTRVTDTSFWLDRDDHPLFSISGTLHWKRVTPRGRELFHRRFTLIKEPQCDQNVSQTIPG